MCLNDLKKQANMSSQLLLLLTQTAHAGSLGNWHPTSVKGLWSAKGQRRLIFTEGDLLLTKRQYALLHRSSASARTKRKAMRHAARLWPDALVYYEILPNLHTREDIRLIQTALEHWSRYSCLRFIEDRGKTSPHRIQFTDDNNYCFSQLGRQKKPQTIGLHKSCRSHGPGYVIHEVGHAIGLIHEHMRPDRDEYVCLDYDNIKEKYRQQYQAYGSDVINTYGVEYDYTSIMHYAGGDGIGNIITLDPSYQSKIGQRWGLSFKDIKLVNLRYNCANANGCVWKDCGPDGFQFFREFKGKPSCECWCDSGDVKDPLVLCSERGTPRPKIDVTKNCTEVSKEVKDKFKVGRKEEECYDVRTDCEVLKKKGYCSSHPDMMSSMCLKSCGLCKKNSCKDRWEGCANLTMETCFDKNYILKLLEFCPATCKFCISEVSANATPEQSARKNGDQSDQGSSTASHSQHQVLLLLVAAFALCSYFMTSCPPLWLSSCLT